MVETIIEQVTPTLSARPMNVIDVGDRPRVDLSRAESAARAFLVRYRVDNTRRTYGVALQQWFDWCLAHDLDPLEATRPHVELFARELEGTGRCRSTVAGKLNTLGVFYKTCVIVRKGGDTQTIVFVPEVAFIVRKHLAMRGDDNGPVFQTRTGRRMDRKSAGRVIKRIAESAGVTKRAHPHAFRKTMATISRNAGVPDREIIAAAGWKTPAMLGYYDGGKETLQTNAAMQLAAFLDRAA